MKPNCKRKSKMLQYENRKQFKQNCIKALLAFNNPLFQERIQELREQILDIDKCINNLDNDLSNTELFYKPYSMNLSWGKELLF